MSISDLIEVSNELLDEKAAAKVLNVADGTLSVWRSTGRYGLPFIKVGRSVRYRRSDLENWLQGRYHPAGATGVASQIAGA